MVNKRKLKLKSRRSVRETSVNRRKLATVILKLRHLEFYFYHLIEEQLGKYTIIRRFRWAHFQRMSISNLIRKEFPRACLPRYPAPQHHHCCTQDQVHEEAQWQAFMHHEASLSQLPKEALNRGSHEPQRTALHCPSKPHTGGPRAVAQAHTAQLLISTWWPKLIPHCGHGHEVRELVNYTHRNSTWIHQERNSRQTSKSNKSALFLCCKLSLLHPILRDPAVQEARERWG